MSIQDVLQYLLQHPLVSVSESLIKSVGPEILESALKLDFIAHVLQYEDFNESHQYLFMCALPHFYFISSLIIICYTANHYERVILHLFFVIALGAGF